MPEAAAAWLACTGTKRRVEIWSTFGRHGLAGEMGLGKLVTADGDADGSRRLGFRSKPGGLGRGRDGNKSGLTNPEGAGGGGGGGCGGPGQGKEKVFL